MKNFLLFLLAITIIMATALRLRYGGGEAYPDLSGTPLLDEAELEQVLGYAEPIGSVAISKNGRLFFTVHPESRPKGNKLLEWVNNAAVPYPTGTVQPHLFNTVLGMVIDDQDRLWTIDHGNHGFATARLLAFDLTTGNIVHDHEFRAEIAPTGSLLQDLQVSADGETVFIADASLWRKQPAIIVYDIETRNARRVLESHVSVSAQDYLIRNPIRDLSYLYGLITMRTGVAGVALDAENNWLYFAAMNHGGLFRVPVRDLRNPVLAARQLESVVERFADKPLSDDLSTDQSGNVYITDVENGAVFLADREGSLHTLIKSSRVRWADGLSFGPDGWLYLADSALPEQILRTSDYISAAGPYFIFRFQPGYTGTPSQ